MSGAILGLGLALLAMRQRAAVLLVVAVQAAVLAGVAAGDGLLTEGAAILVLNACGLPWLLWRLPLVPARRPRLSQPMALAVATALAALAAYESLPLAVMLLGMLTAAVSRDRVTQVAGLLAMQTGIALAALGSGDAERIAGIVPVIPGLAYAALVASAWRRP